MQDLTRGSVRGWSGGMECLVNCPASHPNTGQTNALPSLCSGFCLCPSLPNSHLHGVSPEWALCSTSAQAKQEAVLDKLQNCSVNLKLLQEWEELEFGNLQQANGQVSSPYFVSLFFAWISGSTNLVELQVSKKNFDFSKHLQCSFMYAVRKWARKLKM